jgi:transcriptional regulator with XRE-family HTH domain
VKDRQIDVAALDALRADAGLTLLALARLTGISYSMLRKVHTGQRQVSLVSAVRIARALNCHHHDFTWPKQASPKQAA